MSRRYAPSRSDIARCHRRAASRGAAQTGDSCHPVWRHCFYTALLLTILQLCIHPDRRRCSVREQSSAEHRIPPAGARHFVSEPGWVSARRLDYPPAPGAFVEVKGTDWNHQSLHTIFEVLKLTGRLRDRVRTHEQNATHDIYLDMNTQEYTIFAERVSCH
jgi:hypothetical protein